jgi:hypothetical protein
MIRESGRRAKSKPGAMPFGFCLSRLSHLIQLSGGVCAGDRSCEEIRLSGAAQIMYRRVSEQLLLSVVQGRLEDFPHNKVEARP